MQGPQLPVGHSMHQFPLECMATKFSPFDPSILAVATSENFGVAGRSLTYFLKFDVRSHMCQVVSQHPAVNAVFDIAFSESAQDILYTACGDGFIRVNKMGTEAPISEMKTHLKEVNTVEVNGTIPNLMLSTGTDGFVKVTDLNQGQILVNMKASMGNCYQGVWHPRNPDLAATGGSDGKLKLWNVKQQKPVFSLPDHNNEILCLDFNKYSDIIATGSADNFIHLWDLRMPKAPFQRFAGHRYAVKKVKFSPHHANWLVSGSYDMTVSVWDMSIKDVPLAKIHAGHTEFVTGLDFSNHIPDMITSCSWDRKVLVYPFMGNQQAMI